MITNQDALTAWLNDSRSQKYFSEGFPLKLAVMACLINNGNLSDVARSHGVSRQAVSKQACRARKIFDMATIS
jgi:hypothetical protein